MTPRFRTWDEFKNSPAAPFKAYLQFILLNMAAADPADVVVDCAFFGNFDYDAYNYVESTYETQYPGTLAQLKEQGWAGDPQGMLFLLKPLAA